MISQLSIAAGVAWAQAGGGQQQGSTLMTFLPIIAIFAVMYFLMIRPQSKKAKEHQAMLNSIGKGDRIQTSGGLLGKVTAVDTQEITLEIAPQIRVKIARGAVARVFRPGDETRKAPAKKDSPKLEKEEKDESENK